MAAERSPFAAMIVMVLSTVMLCLFSGGVQAQLSAGYYAKSCPSALSIVQSGVTNAVSKEKRMGASLLRLHFHDCFVNGCDGSVLLDGANGEKSAVPNANSARGFEVIDSIKSNLESSCPGVVSCADILAIAARDSVVALGGPSWNVMLGRRDSRISSQSAANNNIPSPNSTLSQLISKFSAQGLNAKEMTVLAGGHTIGQARCFSFRSRIYTDTDIDPAFATSRKSNCPPASGSGDANLAPLDLQSPINFDNNYHGNLVSKKGLLHSDQQLFSGGSTNSYVSLYASNQNAFFNDFAAAMIKMGNISPLTGSNGEIRKNCRMPN